MVAQQRIDVRSEPTGMARFAGDINRGACAQSVQECRYGRRLIRQAGRQLEQQRPQPVPQRDHAIKEQRQRLHRVAQPAFMADHARQFHREAETRGHARRPPGVGRRLVRAVERGIDLDHRQAVA
jgi:hypothetical protein